MMWDITSIPTEIETQILTSLVLIIYRRDFVSD